MILHRGDGLEVVRDSGRTRIRADLTRHRPRQVAFLPGGRRLLMWAPLEDGYAYKRVALLDLERLEGESPWKIVYDAGAAHGLPARTRAQGFDGLELYPEPFALWSSPTGELLLLERRHFLATPSRELETALLRVDLESGRCEELELRAGEADFLNPPARPDPYLAFTHRDGLFVRDAQDQPARWAHEPLSGIVDCEWDPARPGQVLVNARTEVKVVRLRTPGQARADEVLGAGQERVHTLWYSSGGKWALWASAEAVSYRCPDDPPERTVRVTCAAEGAPLEITGAYWHPDERWLAITAGGRLFLHDAEQSTTREVASVGPEDRLVDPRWVGDRVILTWYEALAAGERRPAPPRLRLRPPQGR